MTADPTDTLVIRGMALSNAIKPLLHGQGPDAQGVALADLVSLFFAGHHPALREEVITEWMKTVRAMIPSSEQEIFDRHGGRPEGWGKQ